MQEPTREASIVSAAILDEAIALHQSGRLIEAEQLYLQILNQQPEHLDVLHNLGTIACQLQEFTRAISYFKRLLINAPERIDTRTNLAQTLKILGDLPEAIQQYKQVLDLDPHLADIHFRLGQLLTIQDLMEEAIAHYQKTIDIQPHNVQAYLNLSNAAIALQQLDTARSCLEKLIAIQPDCADAYWNLCTLIRQTDDYSLWRQTAEQYAHFCDRSDPIGSAIALTQAYYKSGMHSEALEKLVEIELKIYSDPNALSEKDVERLYFLMLFAIVRLRDDLEKNSRLAKLIGSLYAQNAKHSVAQLPERLPQFSRDRTSTKLIEPSNQLRIGFISDNFHRHPVGWCSADTIAALAKLTPYIYLYASSKFKQDDLTQVFEAIATKCNWRNVRQAGAIANIEDQITEIEQDHLDVLIDLDSLTASKHPEILLRQPAKICVSWLGFDAPYLSSDNYNLGDRHTHPPEMDNFYVEKILRLPDSHMAIADFPSVKIDSKSLCKTLKLRIKDVIYLCVTPSIKLNRDTVEAHIQIIKSVPNSILLYKGRGDLEIVKSLYCQACTAQGIDLKRLKFLPLTDTEEEHRSIYAVADVMLDSYPYNGGSHTLEALWFNLPVVTRQGEQSFSRMGYSFLSTLGITTGVAKTWDEYVQWGIRLGEDKGLRNSIKQQLIKSKQPEYLSPLWNPDKLSADMYSTFVEILENQRAHDSEHEFEMGNHLWQSGNIEAAAKHYQQAISLQPDHASAWGNLGTVLHGEGKLDDAIAHYQKSLQLNPINFVIQSNLGKVFKEKGDDRAAIECYEKAIEIDPSQLKPHNRLGDLVFAQQDLDRAFTCFQRAIEIDPTYAFSHNRLGCIHLEWNKIEQAIASFRRSILHDPEYANAHVNLSLALLMQGEYQEGFREYEWRWLTKDIPNPIPNYPQPFFQPLWDGKNFSAQTLLIYAEQGLGDSIQFIRYISLVRELAGEHGRILFDCPKALAALFAQVPGISLVDSSQSLPDFNLHVPLLSLPRILKTKLDSIPSTIPYLFRLGDRSIELDKLDRLDKLIPSPLRIGIVWATCSSSSKIRNRSCPLSLFRNLIDNIDSKQVKCFSLQKEIPPEEIDLFRSMVGQIVDLRDRITDFADTAAIIAQMDLVISIDTAVAHLAGAMGKPVWVILPFSPDWRWMLERGDSPWYPTMRLFRQKQREDWPGAIALVTQAINDLLNNLPNNLRSGDIAPQLDLDALLLSAVNCYQEGRLSDTNCACQLILEHQPENPNALYLLGLVAFQQGHFTDSQKYIEQTIALKPDHAEAYKKLGDIFKKSGRTQESVKAYRQAKTLKPDYVNAYYALGCVLAEQDSIDEVQLAIENFHQAIFLKPDFSFAYYGLGLSCKSINLLDRAIAAFQQAIFFDPDYVDAHVALGLTLLLSGNFRQGWEQYEWRWKAIALDKDSPHFYSEPIWDGFDFRNQTLLIYAEQGHGDLIQFIRYISLVKNKGGKVLLKCPEDLIPLFRCIEDIQLISLNEDNPAFNIRVPLLSLPYILGTTIDTIPNQTPYLSILVPIKSQLQISSQLFKVGLVWATHSASETTKQRSCPFVLIQELSQIQGIDFYSLQKEILSEEREQFAQLEGKIQNLSSCISDFSDTAMLIEQMDLVISVDTSVAHLAGALGKPVWVLLSFHPDWRWLLGCDDSPWYPTMRLFRQSRKNDWTGTIESVACELRNLVKSDIIFASDPKALLQSALAHQKLNQFDDAKALCQKILQQQPDNVNALYLAGIAAWQQGHLTDAIARLQQTIALKSDCAEAHKKLGDIFKKQGKMAEAIDCYQRAISSNPNFLSSYLQLGAVLFEQEKFAEAIECYRQSLKLNPRSVMTLFNLAVTLATQGNTDEAIEYSQAAIQIDPDSEYAHYSLAYVYQTQGNIEQAIAAYRKAIALNPKYTESYIGLGNVYLNIYQYEKAIAEYKNAISVQSDSFYALSCLGSAYLEINQVQAAIDSFRQSLNHNSNYVPAHKNLGIALLLLGNYAEGFAEYEWRSQRPELSKSSPHFFPQPLWDGKDLEGRTLLIYSEQGFGDLIQFVRYIPIIKARYGSRGKIIFDCSEALRRLFEYLLRDIRDIEIVPRNSPLPHFDLRISLLSLPYVLGTNLDTIPSKRYLAIDKDINLEATRKIGEQQAKLKIGLVWASSRTHETSNKRSCHLIALLPLLDLPNIQYYSLQKELSDADRPLMQRYQSKLTDLSNYLGDFADTTAIIDCLDLVITVDTCVAHLAGAMGKPVWVILPFAPDWRWMLERDDSVWYPTMRLFRQTQIGDWSGAIASMVSAVRDFMHGDVMPLIDSLDLDALLQTAIAHQRAGRLSEAAPIYQQILQLQPDNFNALYLAGVVAWRQGNLTDAISHLQQTISLKSDHAEAHKKLGDIFRSQGRAEEAIACYQNAIAHNPNYYDASFGLGILFGQQKELSQAAIHYQQAIAISPDNPLAYGNLGVVLYEDGKVEEAIANYRKCLEIDSQNVSMLSNLALALCTNKQTDEAFECCQVALQIDPNSPLVLYNLAHIYQTQKHNEKAIDTYQTAIELNPNYTDAYIAQGNIYANLRQYEMAIVKFQEAIAVEPNSSNALNWLGFAHLELNQIEQAIAAFREAICFHPNYPEAHMNLGLSLLISGNYAEGLAEYEWRSKRSGLDKGSPHFFPHPLWDGNDLQGQTLLVFGEQGFGDVIQFARYIPLIEARAGKNCKIIFDCQTALYRLFSNFEGIYLAPREISLPNFDVRISLLSLPHLFGTTLETIPASVPYLSIAEHINLEAVRIISDRRVKLKVGIVWASNQNHSTSPKRSCDLSQIASLVQLPNIHFYALQKEVSSSDRQLISLHHLKVTDLSGYLGDFADTAAIVSHLDLIITVDTSVAHLAGALGKSVWLLLPFAPDWRWLLDREDSLWYPTIRLFRQAEIDDWESTIEQVFMALSGLVAKDSVRQEVSTLNLKPNLDEILEEAIAHHQADRLTDAEALYHRIIRYQPQHFNALQLLGALATQSGRLDTAITYLQRALVLNPLSTEAHSNLGCASMQQGNLESAIAHFCEAISIDPMFVDAHKNLGLALLGLGEIKQGFSEYEWRWQSKGFQLDNPMPSFPHPLWDGKDFPNRTLLIYCEQGLGDAIQFSRYIPMVRAKGGKLLLDCPESLQDLFASIAGIEIAPRNSSLPKFDLRIPLMSLPYIFGTTLETIPAPVPYLKIVSKLQNPIALEISQQSVRLKVGIVWASKPGHSTTVNRSLPLSLYLKLLDIPGVKFYSLQKEVGNSDLEILQQNHHKLVNLSDRLSDFAETAAIVESLDLIISIDTSVAHLAGAMGKPVWTLLPCIPDWRWMLEREDSPWYPTMRLFRQQKSGDWESVIDRVGSALHNYLHNLGSLILEESCDTSIDISSEKGYKLLLGADLNIDSLLQEAIALQAEQKLLEATQIYQHILRHQPDNFNALYLLGIVISCQEKPAKAIEYFQRTIALKPDHAEAHKKIGDVYCQLEKPEEAIAYYETACKIKPNYSAACCACAEILVNEAKVEEAIAYYQQVLRYEPDHAIANFMGFLLIPTMYDREEQIADWRQKFTIGLKQYISQSTESLEIKTERQKIFDALGIHTNFYLAYQAKNDLELQQLYGKFLCLAMAKHYPEWTQPLEIPPSTLEGKIRIAYISPHLGDHAGTRGLMGWLRYRDRSKFEVYCYYTEDKPRVGMDAFQAESDRFYHLPNNLEKICKQVYADRIHILVFPDIGMHPLTNYLGALRLAPVQCVCWGHPVTTGLPTVDYFLSSDLMEPEDAQTHYSEQLIRLPQLGLSYLKPSLPAITKTRAAFNLPEDAIVYLTCQSWFKYLPQNDYIFARIATCVPNSKFVFIATDFPHINIKFRQRLQRAFTQFDLDVDRYCIFLQRQLGDDYLSLHLVSDIFLDTIDWSGGSTTLEAIACGSAIVTLPGEFMRGRHSYAMLKILQVEETIANNTEEYIEIAIKLAKDPNWRLSIVQRMCDRHNVLFDDQISVRALEEFYQSVVHQSVVHQSVGHQSVLKAPDLSALLAGAIAEHKAGRLQEAEVLYRKILQHQPLHFCALNMLGTLVSQSGRPEVGIPYILQALEIDPQSAEVHTNLGCAYMQQNDLENAIAHLLRAIALKPDFPDSHNCLGCSYIRQGNLEEAIAHYQQALLLNPNYVDAHYNLGLALLSVGDLKQGFAEYEWRWQRESFVAENPIPPSSQPFWDGTDFRNRTLLIYSEQGLGDTLQFSRYLPMVKAKGGKLLLACPESLQHLLASIEGIEIAPRDLPLPKFDLRFPLMSLPYIFGTALETIPASVPYLTIPAISRSAIALEISQQSAKLKVGLVWASNPSHSTTPNRSFPLSSYLQLLDVPNIKFYSLQKDISDLDLATLQQNQFRLENLSDYLSDFASTAAIVESLDLIISIDTSVAHLAGAMGKPIWTLLPFATDWRWMLEREDSPWYPTMRLFRQPKAGDWANAISMVRDALHNHMTNSFSLQLEPVINTSIATQIEERYELSSADRTDSLNPDALLNEAIALHQAGNLTEAAALYNEILQHQPQHFHALHMLGVIAAQSNQLETGIAYFQKALELNPSDAVAHSFLGLALLTQGDLQNGFLEYEWRWQNPIFLSQHPTLPYTQPQWDGGNSLSQTLLIYCEQGFGDAIQFCRYIPLAKNKVKNIIVDCPEPLRRLFRSFTSIPGIAIAAPNLPLTAFDVHISLISLPQVLKTTLETIPAQVPYLSGLDTSDRADIPSQPNQLKVGLVWASKVNHATAPNRTCALNELNALMDIPGVSFYSLQKEKSDRDREVFAQWLQKYPGKIQDLSDRLDDFADTAVILEQLDLLISIDTAVAHLGGALAKSTWLLLPFAPDWRWMLDREDSPWYPTMRLFRQQEQGNWQEPIARVAADLANLVETNQANIHHDWNHMSLYAPNKIEIGIGWSIGAPIGWGVFGLNLALQMLKTKKFEPYLLTESFRGDGFFNPLHQKLLNSAIAKQQEMQKIITQNPGRSIYIDIPILHALDNITLASKTPHIKGKHNFGYIFFEGAYFNPEAIDTARGYDLILAGSKWNADKLTNCGLTNVCHVIQGIDPTIFHPAPRSNLFGDRFVIFSGGKLEYRKGQDIVVAAFKIFQARHPDALLLTTWHNFWPQFMAGIDLNGYVAGMPAVGTHGKLEIEKWLVDNGLPAESFIDLGLIPNHVTPQILREADVALFPNRCEGGTNLVAMECLACGVPTILSANTGHLDLIDDSHCYPLNNQKPVNPHPHFTSVEDWGESDVNEVVEILECIYSDRDCAKRKGHKAAVFMQELTWENQVQRILNKIMPLTLGATI